MQQSSLARVVASHTAMTYQTSTFSSLTASLQLLGTRMGGARLTTMRNPVSMSRGLNRSFYATARANPFLKEETLTRQLVHKVPSSSSCATTARRFSSAQSYIKSTNKLSRLTVASQPRHIAFPEKTPMDSTVLSSPFASSIAATLSSYASKPSINKISLNNHAVHSLEFSSASSARFFLRTFMRSTRREMADVLRGSNKRYMSSDAHSNPNNNTPKESSTSHEHQHLHAIPPVPPPHSDHILPPNQEVPLIEPPTQSKTFLSRRTFFGVVGGFVVLLVVGAAIYMLFLDQILELLGAHGAKVAQTTLGDERVKQQAQELSSAVVNDLLVQEQLIQHAVQFVKHITHQEETLRAVSDLLGNLLADPATKKILIDAIKDVGYQFIKDEETLQMVTHLAFDLLHQPATKEAVIALLVQVMNDPVQKTVATDFVIDILKRDEVFVLVNEVARNIIVSVLNDEAVKTVAVEFIRQVVSDQAVQKDTGDALYSAVKYAVFPWGWKGKGDPATTNAPLSASAPNLTIPEPRIDITK